MNRGKTAHRPIVELKLFKLKKIEHLIQHHHRTKVY